MTATTPGLVCAHHHLYSALARGMPPPPGGPPADFTQILERVWWRLDAALDLDLVRWSALLGAVEALEAGTTALVDHHASPSAIDGSLDVIAEACAEVGVRVVCAYEVTDRHGPAGAAAGLAENERFLKAGGRGLVGAHACLTLSDATLEAVAGLAAERGVGVHVHVGEDASDAGAAERLRPHATDAWLLAHCVHAGPPLPGTVAHNPRSNMNNGVGYARPARWAAAGNRVVLGSDGIGAAMVDEFALAYAAQRADDVTATPETAWGWLAAGADLVPEVAGDEVTWAADRADPWYLAFTPGVRAERVVVGGEVVVEGGVCTRVDAARIRARAWEEARRLWARL
ncbi:MAG TPA: amidohydrolase family protein [Acidimicrobiales bacterium]|nr:amidohydrolase family protein [Acidimicrobiales bacterium]